MRTLKRAAPALLFVGLLAGCTGAPDDQPNNPGDKNNPGGITLEKDYGGNIARGRILWEEKNCSVCHGNRPNGSKVSPLDTMNLQNTTIENLAEYIANTMPKSYGPDLCVDQCAKDVAQVMIDWVNNPSLYDQVQASACKDEAILQWPNLVRLNQTEFEQTASALINADVSFPRLAEDEFNAFELTKIVTDTMAEAYAAKANEMAILGADAVKNRANCNLDQNTCRDKLIDDVLKTAFRMTQPSAELKSIFSDLFDQESAENGNDSAVEAVLEAALQSPFFIYHSTSSVAKAGNAGSIDGMVQANRISFALTSSPPDNNLMNDAENAALTPSMARDHAERLLQSQNAKDALSERVWTTFFGLKFSPDDRPDFNAEVIDALEKDAKDFVLKHGFNGGLKALLTEDATPSAAAQTALGGGEFGNFRPGLLTSAAWTTRFADHHETNPVMRGLFIRQNLLCQTINPPPDDVVFPDPLEDVSWRKKLASHKEEKICAACHILIDDQGLGLETYDNMAKIQTQSHDEAIETSGALIETSLGDLAGEFNDATELADVIASTDDAYNCAASHWVLVATRNTAAGVDNCGVRNLGEDLKTNGNPLEMILSTVSTDEFLAVEGK